LATDSRNADPALEERSWNEFCRFVQGPTCLPSQAAELLLAFGVAFILFALNQRLAHALPW
jgi:hypothetical protein